MSRTQSVGRSPTGAFERCRGNPAEIYQQYVVPMIAAHFAAPVVDAAELRAGERVLDVACGTGVAARLVSRQVGTAATVVGIDSHPGMLEVARAADPADPGVRWQLGSAESLPFPDASFDAVVCSLGLQFFGDQVTALAQMRRVLAPGGRVAVGVAGPMPELFRDLEQVLAGVLGADVAAFVPAVFALHEAAAVAGLVRAAGLDGVEVRSRLLRLALGAPADFCWRYLLGTPLADAVSGLDPAARAELETEVVARWRPHVVDGDLVVEVGLVLATALRRAD